MSLSIIIFVLDELGKSSSTLATGIAGESRLFKHKEVKSWLMPTWFAQSCPTRLSFMINDSNMFWRCANLDLPSFTANSMKEPRTRIRGYVCDGTKTILGCDRIGWRMWRCVPITCGPQQVSLKCTSWQKTKPESLSFRLKYPSIFLLWCKTHILATINDGGDFRISRQPGWTSINTSFSAVLDYVEVCVVVMYSPSVTAHWQCFLDWKSSIPWI